MKEPDGTASAGTKGCFIAGARYLPQANYSTPLSAFKPPPALLPSPLLTRLQGSLLLPPVILPSPLLARLQGSLLVPPVLLPGQAGSLQGGLGLGGPSLSAL